MLDHNAHLPFPPDVLAKEAQALADKAEQSLANILLQGSTCSVRPHIAFLKLKHKVSYDQLARIARLIFKIFCNAKGDIATEAKTASPLATVLQRLNKLPDCPAPGDDARLSLDWRPIYDALLRVQHRGAAWEEYTLRGGDLVVGAEASKQHQQALLSLLRRARNFFGPMAAKEILEELRPLLCPHEKSLYKAAALLCRMLPDELGSAGGAGAVLPELVAVWEWVPNSMEWQLLWLTLFSRMARHSTEEMLPALQPFLPALLSNLLRILDLPTGKSAPQKPENLGWPADCVFLCDKGDRCKEETVKKYTRLLVFTIAPSSATLPQLAATLDYLRPFFHPLQEGAYTKSLDMLLKMMTLNFAKRLGFESGAHRAKKPWRASYKLTDEDRAEFTRLFLPLALTALSSKDHSMSFGAAQALKDLASIAEAEVLPKLMERMLPAMDNVMRPHEVQAAISLCGVALPVLLRSSEHEGLDFVGQMVQLSLGGIDTNDPMKTMYTLNLFNALLSHMPLADPADLPQCAAKPELLYGLQDWVSEVLERVFQLMQNVPPMKKGNPLRGHVQPLLRRFFDLLLCQLSPTLYAAALDKIARKAVEMFYPPAQEFVGYLLDSAVLAAPEQALGKLVPLLTRRIVAEGGMLAGSESEVAYFTHLLGHAVVRGGDALLAHAGALEEVLGAVALREGDGGSSEEASVHRQGQKLLRKTLHGLLGVFPRDFRSAPPSRLQWAQIKDFRALCGALCDPAAAEVAFRLPSAESQRRARELVTRFVDGAEAKIAAEGVSPAGLRVAFGCLAACVRGGGSLFPPEEMEGGFVAKGEEEEEGVEEEACVGLQAPVALEDPAFGKAMRGRLGALLVAVCGKYAVPDNPDVATLEALLPLVSFFLASKGVWRKHGNLRSACGYNKGVHRFWDQGVGRSYTRRLLQLRAYALLSHRLDTGVLREDETAGKLLEVVGRMCLHEYSLVRKKAQELLPGILRRYPLAHSRLYGQVLQRLKDPGASKGVVSGVVYTVQKGEVLQRVARHWGLTRGLVEGLLGSHVFDDTKVQVRLAELWNQFVPYAHPLPFGGLAHPHSLLQDPDVLKAVAGGNAQQEFEQGEQRGARRVQRGQETHQALVKTLRETMVEGMTPSGGSVHWRFTVLSAAALALQVRRDSALEQATAAQFMHGLNSDLLPLRQLCRAVLPLLRLSESVGAGGGAMEVDGGGGGDAEMGEGALLTPEFFDAPLDSSYPGPFIDPLWAGWNRPAAPGGRGSGEAAAFAAAAKEVSGGGGWWKGVLEKVAQDHRLSGDERAEMSKAAAVGMPLASAAVQGACAKRWDWPRTAAAALADSFSRDTMLAVEALVGALGPAGVDAVLAEVGPMAENHSDREQQCAAAEVLAGVLRAGHEWGVAEAGQLKEKVAGMLGKALGSAPPDSVGVWAEALRSVAANRDPRRIGWVGALVAGLTEKGGEGTSSAQVRGLKLQQALLMEQGWKGVALARVVCGASRAMLSGSSKAVREEAGRGLVLVARATTPVLRDGGGVPVVGSATSEVPVSGLLAEWLPGLLAELAGQYGSSTAEQGSAEAVALRNHIEGVLYFFIHSTRLGQAPSAAALLPAALPLMLAVHEDSDREFAHVGKIALELACTSLTRPAVAATALAAEAAAAAAAASWRVRQAGLQAVREAGHAMVLHPALRDQAFAMLDAALGDAQLEVRVDAASCLAGLLRAMPAETVAGMVARAPKPKRRGAKPNPDQTAEEKAAALVRRHAKVLAVAAAVMSEPTGLTDWMAGAVEAVCSLGNEDPVIRSTITKTVGDFRKSHQDVWEEVRMTWTEEQLRLVQECSGTQSYYS